jgi:PAS domain S-box-containing protein
MDAEHDELLDESLQEIYEDAPVGYISSLVDGTIVRINRTLLGWAGRERGDLVGHARLHDLLAPGARIYYETHVAPLLQMQGEVREIAAELLRADGSRLSVLMNAVLVRDDAGAARVIRTTVVDASERRRYERELLRARSEAESRARAALALEHVAEGVLLVGDTGNVELLNAAAEAILGVAASAAVGLPMEQAVEAFATVKERVTIARRGEIPALDTFPFSRHGEDRWLAVAALDAGEGVVYTFRDVTAERDLDQLRSDVVAIVSHELRTPLTGVYGAAQTMLARFDSLDASQHRMFLLMIVEQSQRLAKILDQILLASSLDSENLRPDVASFETGTVLDSVLTGLAPGERSRVIVNAPASIAVQGDLDRLRQVVANVLDNALKYAPGPVRVSVAKRGASARFTVSDEGPGIPFAERERIFEKFFRLDPSQSGGGGTGLGLYISRELMQRMGGRIGYLPRERGATFYLELPLAR